MRIALLIALLAFALSALPSTAQQETPLIRVGTGPDDEAAPLMYADRAGLFKKAGLNVEVDKLAGAAAVAAALAGGSLEIGKASAMGAVTAIAKGLPFTIIGNIEFYNGHDPNIALLVGANSPIKTAKDLAGQTLADVSLEDMNSVSTFKWLEDHGVDHSSVKYVEIPASASLAAIEANRVAGTTVYEPYYSAYMKTGKVRVLGYPFDAIAPRFSGAVLFTSTQWAADHADLVRRFLRAVAESSAYVAAHEDEAAQLVAAFGGLDPGTIAHIHHGGRGVAINPSDLQPVIDVAARYKVIPEDIPAAKIICSCALRR